MTSYFIYTSQGCEESCGLKSERSKDGNLSIFGEWLRLRKIQPEKRNPRAQEPIMEPFWSRFQKRREHKVQVETWKLGHTRRLARYQISILEKKRIAPSGTFGFLAFQYYFSPKLQFCKRNDMRLNFLLNIWLHPPSTQNQFFCNTVHGILEATCTVET